ncbi:unnamed protein product [Gemmata massiliana]|uniref:Uncharacterized protein n=1 Tax=Gemmata massiliana TaxID=1210884 RepID=A0A6P2DEJ3_9BACT|nr:hypothetical protein [Gemmata massiliana]VTR99980.1 unnamed protein product [Gemmata massiliana]
MRVLDEVAAAVHAARYCFRPVHTATGLEEQFAAPITPRQWTAIQRRLACDIPPLEFEQGHWFLPDGFVTVWDLVDHVARYHPEWELPSERTKSAWREAQIFVGVRVCIAGAGSLDEKDVVRSARLVKDLGLA